MNFSAIFIVFKKKKLEGQFSHSPCIIIFIFFCLSFFGFFLFSFCTFLLHDIIVTFFSFFDSRDYFETKEKRKDIIQSGSCNLADSKTQTSQLIILRLQSLFRMNTFHILFKLTRNIIYNYNQ